MSRQTRRNNDAAALGRRRWVVADFTPTGGPMISDETIAGNAGRLIREGMDRALGDAVWRCFTALAYNLSAMKTTNETEAELEKNFLTGLQFAVHAYHLGVRALDELNSPTSSKP